MHQSSMACACLFLAADVHLTTNITLRSRVTSPQSSLTVSAWFMVDQNSSIAISFQFNNLSCCPLVLHIHTENASDTWKDLSDLFSVIRRVVWGCNAWDTMHSDTSL